MVAVAVMPPPCPPILKIGEPDGDLRRIEGAAETSKRRPKSLPPNPLLSVSRLMPI